VYEAPRSASPSPASTASSAWISNVRKDDVGRHFLPSRHIGHVLESSSSHGFDVRLARQHAHVVPFLKIDDADRARLAADRLGKRVRRYILEITTEQEGATRSCGGGMSASSGSPSS
jgi:hypothetical protein